LLLFGVCTGVGLFFLVALRRASDASRSRYSWAGFLALVWGLIPWLLSSFGLAISLYRPAGAG
jgi:hypothetical protein